MENRNYIVFCVEQGVLQEQAKLLAASLAKQLDQDFEFIAVSPRASHYLDSSTEDFLIGQGVNVIKENLNQNFGHYPIANKLISMKYLEQQLMCKNLIFIDTDTVFTNSIASHLINSQNKLYLRPVDNQGPGTQGVEDHNDGFWKSVFLLFDLPLPKPLVRTTVGGDLIRGYFNAGFIWANNLPGFYQRWYDDFLTIVESGLRPFGYQSRDGNDFRCLDQVALAVTAARYAEHIEILPVTYNYPIPFKPILNSRQGQPSLSELVHVHYHKWFQHPDFLDHVTDEAEKATDAYQWLNRQLPLKPEISGEFKC